MQYSNEVKDMVCVAKGPKHGPAPIPEEGLWVEAKQITDISGFTHGVGWCAPQQGACKLSLNVKKGVIEEALPNATFKVNLSNGYVITAYISGKLRMNYIKIIPGDSVKIEMSPYDLTKGRIVWRSKN